MATYDLGSVTTILDVAKMYNAKSLLPIAEVLHKKNGLFRTAHLEEANQITSHVMTKEKGLPSGTWRSVNEGTVPGNYITEQVVEALSRIEGRSEMDEYLIDIVPDPKEFRRKHDLGHMEGYTQSVILAVLYGDPASDMNKPRGLQVRYNSKSLSNVHSAGASGGTSLYICQWGPGKLGILYPRNAGGEVIKKEDMGRHFVVTNTTTGAGLFKYITRFYSILGIAVYDDRAVQRIGDIGVNGANEVDIDQLFWALDNLPDPEDMSGTVIYCNRLTKYQIEKAVRNRPNMITMDKDQYGQPMTRIRGIPLILLEGISNSETALAS